MIVQTVLILAAVHFLLLSALERGRVSKEYISKQVHKAVKVQVKDTIRFSHASSTPLFTGTWERTTGNFARNYQTIARQAHT